MRAIAGAPGRIDVIERQAWLSLRVQRVPPLAVAGNFYWSKQPVRAVADKIWAGLAFGERPA
jgi:hypothetical protein